MSLFLKKRTFFLFMARNNTFISFNIIGKPIVKKGDFVIAEFIITGFFSFYANKI